MFPFNNDINAYLDSAVAFAKHGVVAGGGADGVKVTGETIDRQKYQSLSLMIGAVATLAQGETLSITVEEQQSDDGSTWDTATAVVTLTDFLTGDTGGSTESGVSQQGIDLQGKKRYVRYNVTPDLSNTATDTCAVVGIAVLGGKRELP